MPDIPKTEPMLPELAIKIKSEHARLMDSGRYLVQHAISIGEDLLKAKATVGHGGFLKWVKDNCGGLSDKTAQRYMKFAENKAKLMSMEKIKFETISNLTLNAAEQLIDGKDKKSKTNASDTYDKVQDKLIEKLKKLEPDSAEAAVEQTIEALKKTLKDIKQIAANTVKKAA
jgi:DUF3102 family protein